MPACLLSLNHDENLYLLFSPFPNVSSIFFSNLNNHRINWNHQKICQPLLKSSFEVPLVFQHRRNTEIIYYFGSFNAKFLLPIKSFYPNPTLFDLSFQHCFQFLFLKYPFFTSVPICFVVIFDSIKYLSNLDFLCLKFSWQSQMDLEIWHLFQSLNLIYKIWVSHWLHYQTHPVLLIINANDRFQLFFFEYLINFEYPCWFHPFTPGTTYHIKIEKVPYNCQILKRRLYFQFLMLSKLLFYSYKSFLNLFSFL